MRRKDAADPLEPRFFSFLSWRYFSFGVISGFKILNCLGSDPGSGPGPARYLALLKTGCRTRCCSCENFRQEIKRHESVTIMGFSGGDKVAENLRAYRISEGELRTDSEGNYRAFNVGLSAAAIA